MLKLRSCNISLGSAFHCLLTLTNSECKNEQFTLASGCLNLNEWSCSTVAIKFKIIIAFEAVETMDSLVAL